jgi:hypothetical protein
MDLHAYVVVLVELTGELDDRSQLTTVRVFGTLLKLRRPLVEPKCGGRKAPRGSKMIEL